jgi:hypothetical protein
MRAIYSAMKSQPSKLRVAVVALALAIVSGCSSVQYLPDGQLGHN